MSKDKKISLEEVEHIAELARIKLTKEEKIEFSDELSDILGYIGQLEEVKTNGIEPVSQVAGLVNVLRDDVTENSDEDTRRTMIDNFPDKDGEYIKVKQVM